MAGRDLTEMIDLRPVAIWCVPPLRSQRSMSSKFLDGLHSALRNSCGVIRLDSRECFRLNRFSFVGPEPQG